LCVTDGFAVSAAEGGIVREPARRIAGEKNALGECWRDGELTRGNAAGV
jgi:hypothetical protein